MGGRSKCKLANTTLFWGGTYERGGDYIYLSLTLQAQIFHLPALTWSHLVPRSPWLPGLSVGGSFGFEFACSAFLALAAVACSHGRKLTKSQAWAKIKHIDHLSTFQFHSDPVKKHHWTELNHFGIRIHQFSNAKEYMPHNLPVSLVFLWVRWWEKVIQPTKTQILFGWTGSGLHASVPHADQEWAQFVPGIFFALPGDFYAASIPC